MSCPLKCFKNPKILLLGFLAVFIGYFLYPLNPVKTEKYCVALTQIADHPSLDKIRSGIIDTLKNHKIKVKFQSAQGNLSIASQIASQFVSENPDVIIPITTPSAQTVYAVTQKTSIPVVFSAVSDPYNAKLIANHKLTGVQDRLPIKEQLQLIKDLCPKAKRIGVLYNPGESNSVSMIREFKSYATDYVIIEGGLSHPHQISAVIADMMKNVDVLYIPNDNMAISHFDTILKVAKNIPIFTSDPESVEKGALASLSPDQYKIGVQTAKLAMRVLKGEKNIPIQKVKDMVLSINMRAVVLHKIKPEYSQSVRDVAKEIKEVK